MPEHFKVIRIVDEIGITREGATRVDVRVDFNVGTNGPFTVRVPKQEFSAERVRKEIKEFATQVRELMPEDES